MKGTFKFAALVTVALVVLTSTTVSAQSNVDAVPSGVASSMVQTDKGVARLNAFIDVDAGSWAEVLVVQLDQPGTYLLDADVRGLLQGAPSVNTHIIARLWSDQLGRPIDDSERMVCQIMDLNAGDKEIGHNATAPISSLIDVRGQGDTIRLQATRIDRFASAHPVTSRIYSDAAGRTVLRFALTRLVAGVSRL